MEIIILIIINLFFGISDPLIIISKKEIQNYGRACSRKEGDEYYIAWGVS